MSFLGRLLGKSPPRIPAGGRLFVDTTGPDTCAKIVIRVQMPGGPQDATCKQIGPSFTDLVKANQYQDWCEGGPPFVYGPGAV